MPLPEAVAREQALESGVFPRRPMQIVRGHGSQLTDSEGDDYLDAGASYGTNHVGHRHPRVMDAIHAQAERLLHIPSTYGNDTRLRFLETLGGFLPSGLERTWLCSSGTEAIEAAIKFARQATGRTEVVSLQRGFHGRTFGALSATAKAQYRMPFEPLVPGFSRTAPNDLEALDQAITREVAAFLVEPVQGEGGVLPLDDEYLRAARDITTDRGVVLVADEVQTGLGRTGRFLACEHAGVTPDIACLGKGLGGGLPLAATIMSDAVASDQSPGSHGATFSGNPMACAAGTATLEAIRNDGLIERAAVVGQRLLTAWQPLEEVTGVRNVRGRGLMLGIELTRKPYALLDRLVERNILALPAGATVLRFLPPLVITDDEAATLADVVAQEVCTLGGDAAVASVGVSA